MEALGINLPGLVTQVLSFLVLFALLYRFVYKPVLGAMDRRSTRIRESLEAAQKARDDAARTQAEMQKQIEAARAEGQALIAQARDVAERFREEELARARQEIQAERERAQANIQRERDAAIEELRRQFAGLAITAAERVVQRSLDERAHRDLIEQVLEEGSQASRN